MAPLRPLLPRLGVIRLPIRTLTTQPPSSSDTLPSPPEASSPEPPANAPSDSFGKLMPVAANSKSRIVIPPHAKTYLPLPTPPQAEEPVPTRQRGYLPVPRNPFPKHEGDRKVQDRYYKKTTPTPLAKNVKNTSGPEGSRTALKQVMAETRREALRDSLGSLWQRKHAMSEDETRMAKQRWARYDARVERTRNQMLMDSLTRPTIPAATRDTGVKPDPDRFERAQSRRVKHRRKQREKMEARRDAVMDLYHNATGFFVNEADYKAEVEKVFASNYFERWGSGESVWDVWGPPPGMEDIMSGGTSPSAAAKYVVRAQNRSAQRLRTLGEEMTGGKMV